MTKEQEEADKLYMDSYDRWCNELSHDKNYLKAKDIALYLINNNIKLAKDYNLTALESYYLRVKKLIEQK
jgi:hypothetical protein